MLQTIKIKGDEKNIFVSSDLHIMQTCATWDSPLWETRGYQSKESHRLGVIKSWNGICNESSTVILLGDVVFEDENGDEFRELLRELNYKKLYCLLGNHNSGHGITYKKVLSQKFPQVFSVGGEVYPLEWEINKNKGVTFLPQYAEFSINKHFLVASHYPLASHNKMSKRSIHVCGHSHGRCVLTNRAEGKGLRVDCGWDEWSRPISFFEIREYLKGRDIHALDHHTEGSR